MYSYFHLCFKVALQEVKDQNLYLTRCIQGHVEESAQTENLLLHLMKAAKSLYLTLRSQDSVPSYIEADFNVSLSSLYPKHCRQREGEYRPVLLSDCVSRLSEEETCD